MAIGLGKNFEVGTGDDAQSAIAADEQLHQIVASNVLDDASTAFGDDAVAGHKADADAEISQSTVTVPQGTVRRRGQQAADAGALRMQRINRQKLAMLTEGVIYFLERAARAYAHGEIARIIVLDAVQPARVQQHVNGIRNIADGLLRESAAGHNHQIFFRCEGNDRGDFAS